MLREHSKISMNEFNSFFYLYTLNVSFILGNKQLNITSDLKNAKEDQTRNCSVHTSASSVSKNSEQTNNKINSNISNGKMFVELNKFSVTS